MPPHLSSKNFPPIKWKVANPDLRMVAAALCSRDSFFALRDPDKRVAELLKDQIYFRERLIGFDHWEAPENVESSLVKSWKFYYHSLVWLAPLRHVYRIVPDENYKDVYLRNIREWLTRHGIPPTPLPTQKEPGDYTWYDMSAAWRTMVIIGAISMSGPEPDLIDYLSGHADVLMDDTYYAGLGNHALHQNYALMSAATVLNRQDQLESALTRIEALRQISIDDEGVALEGSAGYHLFNMDWWLNMDHQLKQVSRFVDDIAEIQIPDMRPFLRSIIAPDGKIIPLGDSTMSKGLYRNVINEYPDHFTSFIEDDPTLVHALSCGLEGTPATETMQAFSDGFWFSRCRSNDREPRCQSHATIKFGPGLAERVHAHDDAGSITFYPRGIRLLEEGGMFGYYGGNRREFVKSNLAHNTVVVPGRKYYRSAVSPLHNARSTPDFDQAEVEVLALERTRWRRLVAHAHGDDLMLIQDIVDAGDATFQQIFNLGDGFRVVEMHDGRVDVQDEAGNRASLVWLSRDANLGMVYGREAPLMGWRSTFEGELHPITCITAGFSPAAKETKVKVALAIVMLAKEEDFRDIALDNIRFRATSTLFDLRRKTEVLECMVTFGGNDTASRVNRRLK